VLGAVCECDGGMMSHVKTDNEIIIDYLHEINENLMDVADYLRIMAGVSQAYECTQAMPSPSHEE